MAKSIVPPALYRLIEAGHLARQAVLAPLAGRGLSPGDDAILLALESPEGEPEAEIMELTGLDATALAARLDPLAERGILERVAIGPEAASGVRLTGKGRQIHDVLKRHWQTLNAELIESLPGKRRRHLKRTLEDVIAGLGG